MISWLFSHFFWVVLIIVGINMVRMIRRVLASVQEASKKLAERNPRQVGNFDPDGAERARRIREEIMRKIAERQAGAPVLVAPPLAREISPPASKGTSANPLERWAGELTRRVQETSRRSVPPLDPFGGGWSRSTGRTADSPPPVPVSRIPLPPEISRADRPPLTLPAEAREFSPRAAAVRPRNPALAPATYEVSAARAGLLNDLSDVRSLRRAFILREVLGTPVGLQ